MVGQYLREVLALPVENIPHPENRDCLLAALRCHGLLKSDPERLAEAAARYRAAGPAVELAGALEGLAFVLAMRGYAGDARAALNEAVALYEGMQAWWDIRRVGSRLRSVGIKRGYRDCIR